MVNAVLLKPLTFPDPDRIVQFLVTSPTGPNYGGSATRFNLLRQQADIFTGVAAYEYNGQNVNLTTSGLTEQIHAIHVTAGYFRLFGAPVALGRTFTADDDRPNGGHAVVLSHGLWQRRFGGDAHLPGQSISLNGVPYVVTGILGSGFHTELDTAPDLWLPFQIDPNSRDHAQYFALVGRLRPGITLRMANAKLQIATEEFRRKFPNIMGPRDAFSVVLYPDALVSDVRASLLILAGAVGFVLLIACANVANLLLVRASARRREIAIRAAVGAGQGRIIRQLLTESIVLFTAGGGLGLILGTVALRALLLINSAEIPRIGEHGAAVSVDWRVLAFTLLVSVLTGVVFGLIPALDGGRADLVTTLKESAGRAGSGFRQNRTRSLLVIGETALALVLLVGAALLIRTFFALRAVDPGFNAHNILTLQMSLAGSRFESTADVNGLIWAGVEKIDTLPGVASVAASYTLPLEGGFGIPFNIAGRSVTNRRYDGRGWISVSPLYFETFRIPILRGRAFNERDGPGTDRVAIVNQAMAHRFWPDGDPLHDRILLGHGYGPEFEEPARQIVGVVGDVHDFGLNRNPAPMVYVPMSQVTGGITSLVTHSSSLAWIIRTRVEPHSLRAAIEHALGQQSGGLAVAQVRSMDQVLTQSTSRADFNMSLLTIFGCAALLFAVVGIYGLMAYTVQQRAPEIGIRLALGAEPGDVRNMIVGHGMYLAAVGIALGIVGSLGLTRVLQNLLFGVKAWDPVVFTLVPLVLSAAALVAVWFPARRATRIDPVQALRHS